MSTSNGEANAHKPRYRKILLTDAAWQTLQRAVLLREAMAGALDESSPVMFGHRVNAIIEEWLAGKSQSIRLASVEDAEKGPGSSPSNSAG